MGQDSKADLLPEVIEKSPEEIDKIIAAINSTDGTVNLTFEGAKISQPSSTRRI